MVLLNLLSVTEGEAFSRRPLDVEGEQDVVYFPKTIDAETCRSD